MRDDFTQKTRGTLAKRANHVCSNPECKRLTSGPHEDPNKSIDVGVGAHITAASPGGPRYNSQLTSEQRKSITNGIWLCNYCSRLIDTDEDRFSEQLLHTWKKTHEESVFRSIVAPNPNTNADIGSLAHVELQVVPNGKRDGQILLVKVSNISVTDILITSIRFDVVEFRYVLPFGDAKSSKIGEIDLSELIEHGKTGSIPMYRIVKAHEIDEFSVVLSAGRLSGAFAAWNLDINLRLNSMFLPVGGREIAIPAPKKGSEESFEEFKSSFVKVYRDNKQGFAWWQNMLMFRRRWFKNGFTFSYMSRFLYYSGPTNFLKER